MTQDVHGNLPHRRHPTAPRGPSGTRAAQMRRGWWRGMLGCKRNRNHHVLGRGRGTQMGRHAAALVMLSAFLLPSSPSLEARADTPLLDAVKNHDGATVDTLLAAGVDVDAAQPDGATALHWAVQLDDAAIVERLILAGATVDATNEYGVTPLSLACSNAGAALVERLLEAGADPQPRASHRRDAADAGGEHRQRQGGRGAHRARRRRASGRSRTGTDTPHVGDLGRPPGRGGSPDRAGGRRRRPLDRGIHAAVVRGAGRRRRHGPIAVGRGRRCPRRDGERHERTAAGDAARPGAHGHPPSGARSGPERRRPRLHPTPLGGRVLADGVERPERHRHRPRRRVACAARHPWRQGPARPRPAGPRRRPRRSTRVDPATGQGTVS